MLALLHSRKSGTVTRSNRWPQALAAAQFAIRTDSGALRYCNGRSVH